MKNFTQTALCSLFSLSVLIAMTVMPATAADADWTVDFSTCAATDPVAENANYGNYKMGTDMKIETDTQSIDGFSFTKRLTLSDGGAVAANKSTITFTPPGGGTLTVYARSAENKDAALVLSDSSKSIENKSAKSSITKLTFTIPDDKNKPYSLHSKETGLYVYCLSYTQTPVTHAEPPKIDSHPSKAVYTKGQSTNAMTISAKAQDGGILSYQWYQNNKDSNTNGTPISGATGTTYKPPSDTVGTMYYYVVVTNTNNSVNGNKTASATSNAAAIEIKEPVHAEAPKITVQPFNAAYKQNDIARPLYVAASVSQTDGQLAYQWYATPYLTNTGGMLVGYSQYYTPPTQSVGTMYYYAVVTNTNNSISGNQTASTTSTIAAVTVTQVTYTLSVNSGYGDGNYTANQQVSISAYPAPNGKVFAYWISSNGGRFANQYSPSTTFTMPANAVIISPVYQDSNSGQNLPPERPDTESNIVNWINGNEAEKLIKQAEEDNDTYIETKSGGKFGLKKEALSELDDHPYRHSTVLQRKVKVRVTISDPGEVDNDVLLSGSVNNTATKSTIETFNKYFENDVSAIHLDQQNDWGTRVRIAVKANLTGMDKDNLYLYSFNPTKNTYKPIRNAKIHLDKNNYLHFYTPYAREIVISEGPLVRK